MTKHKSGIKEAWNW